MSQFPLDQWFDITRRISKEDADLTEAQIMLYALKSDDDPNGPEARKCYRQLREAVKKHNRKFDK